MAKRKKLNKRLVVLLIVLGAVLVAGGVIGILNRLPKDPKALAAKAEAAIERRDFVTAAADLRQAINATRDTDPSPYHYQMAQLNLKWMAIPGQTQTQRSAKLTSALGSLRQALLRRADYVEAQELMAQLTWEITRNPNATGRAIEQFIEEATKLLALKEASGLQAEDSQTFLRRASARARLAQNVGGRYVAEALADFQQAIQLQPEESEPWLMTIAFLLSMDRQPEAEEIFAQAIETNPDNAQLRVSYADYLYQQDRKTEAYAQCEQAIQNAPSDPTGNIALARLHARDENFDAAMECLQDAKEADPTSGQTYVSMADIYIAQGQRDQAIEALREGLSIANERADSPDLPAHQRVQVAKVQTVLQYMLAGALLDNVMADAGDAEEAIEEARQCLAQIKQIDSNNSFIPRLAGQIAYAEGDLTRSAKLLETALASAGGLDVKAAELLIRLYERQGLPGKAEHILDRLLVMPVYRDSPQVLLLKARFLMSYRDYDEAEDYVDRVLSADPENEQALALKGTLAVASGRLDKLPDNVAVTAMEARLIVDRATSLWTNGQREEALKILEGVHAKAPTDLAVVARLAGMYQSMKELDKAKAILDNAIKIAPDNEGLRVERQLLDETDPDKRLQMRLQVTDRIADPLQRAIAQAGIYATYGQKDQYIRKLKEAIEIDPRARVAIARIFLYALQEEDWDLAEEMVAKAIEYDLDGASGHVYSGDLARAQDDLAKAITEYTEALTRNPNNKRARTLLGSTYLQDGQIDKAQEAYLIVVENDPGYLPALIGMAKTSEAKGEWDQHNEYIRRAYQMPSGKRDPYVRERQLVVREEASKDLDAVIAERQEMLASKPEDISNTLRLGVLYERTGQMDKAKQMYQRFYSLVADKLAAARVLASFYARTDQEAEAERLLQDLLAVEEYRVGAYILYAEFLAASKPDQAENAFREAVKESGGKHPAPYLALSQFLSEQGKWKAAADAMGEYLKLRPEAKDQKKRLVRLLLADGQLDRAGESLDELIRADSADAEALTIKGILAGAQDDYNAAEELFDHAIQVNGDYGEAYVNRARIYVIRGQLDKARKDLATLKKLTVPPNVTMDMVTLLVRIGDTGAAKEVLRDILAKRGNYAPAMVQLVTLYARDKNWTLLEPLLANARARYPKDPGYAQAESQMWVARGDTSRALAAIKDALELSPDSQQILTAYLSVLFRAGKYDQVIAESETHLTKPAILAVRAAALAKKGQTDAADEAYIQAIKEADDDAMRVVFGQILAGYGTIGAITKLDEYVKARPDDYLLLSFMGELYRTEGQYDEAVELLGEALKLASQPGQELQGQKRLAMAYYGMGEFQKAEQSYVAALEIDPNDPGVLNNLGYLYTEDMNLPEKGLPYAETAALAMPAEPNVLDTYGWTLAKLGQSYKAEQILLRAMQVGKPTATIRYHLGRVYEQMDRLDEAVRQYQSARAIVTKTDACADEIEVALERIRTARSSQ